MSDTQLEMTQLYQLAQNARIDGDYDQAIALLTRVLDDDPNQSLAHFELGLAYCFTGLFDESIREMELAAGLDIMNPEIHFNLAKTYTMLGMYQEGALAFQTVLGLTTLGDKFFDESVKQLSFIQEMM